MIKIQQLSPSLSISALGKKRHRIDFARQLVVSSLTRCSEIKQDLAYAASSSSANGLLPALDPSLPWWAEKTRWARWSSSAPAERSHRKDHLEFTLDEERVFYSTVAGKRVPLSSQHSKGIKDAIHELTNVTRVSNAYPTQISVM